MKRNKLLLTISAFVLFLFGVVWSIIPRLQTYQKTRQMKAAADSYMQNKYGISAELEKYELQFGEYYLWMKTQDKEFFLFLNEEFQPLSDAYQYDEIRDALTGLIRETYPGIVSGEIQIYNPPSEQYT